MKQNLLHSLLTLLLLLLGLCGPARATAPPLATGRPLAEALNPDGTLKAGANGSFDARAFRMGTAPDGRPVFRPAGTAGAGDERWASGFGLANGVDAGVSAIVQSGTDVYIGGSFTIVGNVPANRVAKWNGTTWTALGTGTNETVQALAVAGNGDLYAGGSFTQAGGVAANHVAKWNGTAWSALSTGLTAAGGYITASALAVAGNGDVYAGGQFTTAGGTAASNVAKWNGTSWSPMGTGANNGVNDGVYALAVAGNGTVYAGGQFTTAGGAAASRVAKWDGTAWSALGTGVSNGQNTLLVFALAVAGNGDVYMGGQFTAAGGIAARNIAKWNGTAWSPVGTGTSNGVNFTTESLTVAGNGDVYAGGTFTTAGLVAANRVARWNGTTWSSLGTGPGNGTNDFVFALLLASNGDVYVGGYFTTAGGTVANQIAKWNGTTWNPLGPGPGNGVNGSVNALVVAGNGDVYVGGQFRTVGGIVATNVAKWNGTAWSPLGDGVNNNGVRALAVTVNGDVYVGGNFDRAGGIIANNVARWNGAAWSALGTGTGNGVNNTVYALVASSNGDVYAGGQFTTAGGAASSGVGRWNGITWSPLGTGLSGGVSSVVRALAVAGNGDIYAGGNFTTAGGASANSIARWNGTAWNPLGSGITGSGSDGIVYALAVAGNNVYAGGDFTTAGGAAANNIAKWNGTSWSPLVSGLTYQVYALTATNNGDVYAGGYLFAAGGRGVSYIAKWNGTVWDSPGTGLNNIVYSLATSPSGKIVAGGLFTTTGDGRKVMAHFGIYDPNAPLATTAATRTAPAALFPNPAHGTATLRLPVGAPRQPLTLTDALGRVVRRYPAPAGPEAELDLRGLPAGIYVVGCGQLTQRLVVE